MSPARARCGGGPEAGADSPTRTGSAATPSSCSRAVVSLPMVKTDPHGTDGNLSCGKVGGRRKPAAFVLSADGEAPAVDHPDVAVADVGRQAAAVRRDPGDLAVARRDAGAHARD